MADKLRVLVINDEREMLAPFNTLLDIDHASEPEEAQEFLLKSQSTEQNYDIVACDVNFERSDTVGQFVRSNNQDPAIVPLGPILALPFLSSRSTVFVPYSSYWYQLRHNPDIMMLAALGMIEARNLQKVLTLRDIAGSLLITDEEEGRRFLPGTFVAALGLGLAQYRKRLFAEPGRLQNVGRLASRVDALKTQGAWPPEAFQEALSDVQCRVARPIDAPPLHSLLRDESGIFELEVVRVRRLRTIALSSLYADYFLSSLYPDDVTGKKPNEEIWAHAFQVMSDDFETAKDQPGGSIDVFAKEVAETLKLTDQTREGWQRGNTINAVLKARRKVRADRFPNIEEGYFARACVLGAWTGAWALHRDALLSQREIKPAMKRILGLIPAEKGKNNEATTLYRRLFINEETGEPRKDAKKEVSWAAPFRRDAAGIEQWSLDTDEPSNLTPFDRTFCETYAALSEAEGG